MSERQEVVGRSKSSIRNYIALSLVLAAVVIVALGAMSGRMSMGAALGPGIVLVVGVLLYTFTGGGDEGDS